MKNVSNLINDNGNKVANQFRIATDKGVYFQSYESVICFVPNGWKKPILSKDWNYSRTTLKHLKSFLSKELKGLSSCGISFNQFITKKEIEKLIEKGAFRYIKDYDLATPYPKVDFTRINNDVCGNPRYVCHFLNFANDYDDALRIAKEMGGGKFNNKQYGGGIVFQCYNIDELEEEILQLQS